MHSARYASVVEGEGSKVFATVIMLYIFLNWHDICKVAKAVHENRSDNHCNR